MPTYSDYIVNAALEADNFGKECLNIAADFAASVPQFAGDVAAAMADYGAATSQIAQQISYEAYQAAGNAASRLAEMLEHSASEAPSYIVRIAAAAADYTAAAAAAASDFIINGDDEINNLTWIQKQDDGVYVSGDDGTSSGAVDGWEIPTHFAKYPSDVPLVPPQIIPNGVPKIKKIQPQEKTTPHGCLNKSNPTLGKIFRVQYGSDGADIDVFYWDNIIKRQVIQSFDTDSITRSFFAGTPCPMPSFLDISQMTNISNGRYAILWVKHHQIANPPGIFHDYYDTVEGWKWIHRYGNYLVDTLKEHGDEYYECLALEFNDYHGEFFHPPDYPYVPGWSMFSGEGHAVRYTYGKIGLKYIGIYDNVEETPVYAATLASIGIVDAFRNAINMLFLPDQRS